MAMTVQEIRASIQNLCEKDEEVRAACTCLDQGADWPINGTFPYYDIERQVWRSFHLMFYSVNGRIVGDIGIFDLSRTLGNQENIAAYEKKYPRIEISS